LNTRLARALQTRASGAVAISRLTVSSCFNYDLTMPPKSEDVEVVSFRVPKDVLEQFDRVAEMERRPRASMIRSMMESSVNAVTMMTRNLEWQVKIMADLEEKYPDSPQLEYRRGQLHATKALLSTFLGERTKNHILQKVRRKTGLPIPHIIPLDSDGNRYGWDSDAG
jgi:predicted transcriptional regulator